MAIIVKKKKVAEVVEEQLEEEVSTGKVGAKESDKVLAALVKTHGKNFGAHGGNYPNVLRVPTGIFPIDLATGGGFPRLKSTNIYGPESSGKTILLYLLIAEVQRQGQTAVLVDVEDSHEDYWASNFGVDAKKLIVIKPDNATQAVDAVEAFIHADDVGIVGLDSLAMMITANELNKGAEVAAVGGASAIIGKLYRKVGSGLTQMKKAGKMNMFVIVNQTRYKIGQMFGNPETTPGGQIPKFVSALTVRVSGKKTYISAVSDDAPAMLHVEGRIEKWKVPIVGTNFEYDMALIPHAGLDFGGVDSWKTITTRLNNLGGIAKAPKGWVCLGDQYKTLEEIRAKYNDNHKFAAAIRNYIVDHVDKIGAQPLGKKK